MPFKKGEPSANPKGRPVGSLSLVDILRRKLEAVEPGCDNTKAELLVDQYLSDAMKSESLKKDAFDRIDGKPKSGDGELGTKDNPIHTVHKVLWE